MALYPGPYITLSPPPTAGPLPVIERANLNTPYSGGGGGGGPSTIGPNPVVSSITTNAGGGNDIIAAGVDFNIYGSALTQVCFAGGQLAGGAAFEITADTTANSDLVFLISTNNIFGGGITGTSLVIQSDGVVNGAASLGALPDGTSYIASYAQGTTTPLSTLNVYADAVNMSSLNVSSINGAAPGGGGGGPPPAVVSTISSLINVSTINVGSPGLVTIAGGVSVLDYVGAGSISTGSIVGIAPGGAVSVPNLGTSSITSAAGQINVTVPTSMSSLTVSSINGAAPGGGSAPHFSSIGIPGTLSTFVCGPGATTLMVPFSTVAGHVYSATVLARAQVFEAAANGDTVYTEILDDTTGNEALGNWSAQMVSTITAGGSLQYVGGTVIWKAGGTGAAFSCNPSVSTSIKVDALNLLDFGAV